MNYHYHYNYIITNLNNHIRYIGVRSCNCQPTEDIKYWSSCKTLKKIILKEGSRWFRKDIIALWGTRTLAVEHEIRLHNHFEVGINPMFYNRSKQTSTGWDTSGIILTSENRKNIGNGSRGHVVTEETRRKISKSEKGKKVSKETRKKLSDINKDKKLSSDTCKKMSKSRMGYIVTEKTRRKMSKSKIGANNPMYNKNVSDETKNKLSKSSKGRKYINKNGKNKMAFESELNDYLKNGWVLGRYLSKEIRRKMGRH